MALEISVNNPDFPKGHEFDVGGVLVKNGGSTKLTAEQEAAFEAKHGASVKDTLKGSGIVKVSGTTETGKGGES